MDTGRSTISLAFRFHVNFYHSYRGDSLDERGIGKDIRVIRSILDDLDALNAAGIPVCGTWDIENYYSLETYLPRHAPDIVERIRSRVAAGRDEIELMSYNNGIVSAHTTEEFERAIEWAIHNPAGSGIADVFDRWAPIVRPQECMVTPSHIASYRAVGVEAISIYYSALPFNAFSTFVPPLPFEQRYNPVTLTVDGFEDSITLLPAYNHGDIADHWGSLKRWLRALRRHQLRLGRSGERSRPAADDNESALADGGWARDLLLVIDMDADDEFWSGLEWPIVPRLFPAFGGLARMVRTVADLPYLRFVRPYDYLGAHEPVGTVVINRDTADGSYDGYASWAEKWSNTELWTRINAARRSAEAARRGEGSEEAARLLDNATTARLLAMSTTHFGLASPVMNRERLRHAYEWADRVRDTAKEALAAAFADPPSGANTGATLLFDAEIDRLERGRGALVTLDSAQFAASSSAGTLGGTALSALTARRVFGCDVVQGVFNPERSVTTLDAARGVEATGAAGGHHLRTSSTAITNGLLEVCRVDDRGVEVLVDGRAVFAHPIGCPWVRYGSRIRKAVTVAVEVRENADGALAELRLDGRIDLGVGVVEWSHLYTVAEGLPYLFVDVEIEYPPTPGRGFDRSKAKNLDREWDGRWREIAPCELVPALSATPEVPITVWKHNFQDAVSFYRFDQHRFSANRTVASSNNQITDGWVAVTDGSSGLIVAQSAAYQNSFAFCPMRVRTARGSQQVRLNPFGTYHGAQLRYPTAVTGLGRRMALATADQLDSYAPSFAGRRSRFSLMVAPYTGDRPPESLQRDALLFAGPPVVVTG